MSVVSTRGPYYARIVRKLSDALSPSHLVVIDETSKHAGHRESSGKTETHFRVEVVSGEFEGLRLIERQRRVYDILREELNERIHALSMVTRTPEELEKRGHA